MVVIFAAGIVTTRFLREPDIAVAEETYRFELAQQDAIKAGNHVVYSRHMVNNSGRPAWTATFSHWKSLPSGAVTNAPVQVVFVHGYNTTFAESMVRGNYLCRLIRQWTAQKNPEVALDFHTFSWRADFGPDRFHTAELAATVQSASLAFFLKSLVHPGAPAPKIILITHSLGARVVLDALAKHGAEPDFPEISSLLMVQPAIARTAIARGTYETRLGDTVNTKRYSGEFFAALGRVRTVFATASSADGELSQYDYAAPPELNDAPHAPKLSFALGQPYYSNTEAEQFPDNFKLIELVAGPLPRHGAARPRQSLRRHRAPRALVALEPDAEVRAGTRGGGQRQELTEVEPVRRTGFRENV